MAPSPEFLDWSEICKTDDEFIREFYEAKKAYLFWDKAELAGTLLNGDPKKRAEWLFIGNMGGSTENHTKYVTEATEALQAMASPLIGRSAKISTTNIIRKCGESYVEEIEDYSPREYKGFISGFESITTLFTTRVPKGYGDHLPGQYPKDSEFEHFRFCLKLGELLVPVRELDGSWNRLTLEPK